MKFLIRRTSICDDNCPHPKAKMENAVYVDARGFKTPEEYDARFPKAPWLSQGANHRIVPRGIERDFPTRVWTVEIKNLADLIALSKAEGELVITASTWQAKNLPAIEIYDSYRE